MSYLKFKINRYLRKFKFWMIRKACTEQEWRTLRLVRAGYYGYQSKGKKPVPTLCGYHRIKASFELNNASHDFLHSDEGQLKYDAQYGIAHKLIREREEDIAKHVSYVESWDAKRQVWVCEAELDLVEVCK